jgi:hypothetical protein
MATFAVLIVLNFSLVAGMFAREAAQWFYVKARSDIGISESVYPITYLHLSEHCEMTDVSTTVISEYCR